jgi:hypothetical protein
MATRKKAAVEPAVLEAKAVKRRVAKNRLLDMFGENGDGGNGEASEHITLKPGSITRPNIKIIAVTIVGTTPYMQLRFPEKARNAIQTKHEAGSQAKSKKTREARDFEQDYQQAFHRLQDGSFGIPCASIRNAMIDACRSADFVMTQAKQAVWCLPDGLDDQDGTTLFRIIGKPRKTIQPVRNANGGTDLRVRPQWDTWSAKVRLKVNLDVLSIADAVNLLMRAGELVGIGEGRIGGTKKGYGQGLGSFSVETG